MNYIHRLIEKQIQQTLKRGKSVLMLGPRQTGKTTLLKHQIKADRTINFADPELRLQYEIAPHLLKSEVTAITPSNNREIPLIVLDEIQKVPQLLDLVQVLIDDRQAQFILTGSSARKLKRNNNINLLPGRVTAVRLDPLSLLEIPTLPPSVQPLLLYGSLPEIFLETKNSYRDEDLKNYVLLYLEEEIRAEALVRNIGTFARFLECVSLELGHPINMEKNSQDIGVKRNTIANYYEILLDCLIADRIEPITHSSTRQRLTKADKYLFFDLGVKRICSREGSQLSEKTLADLFEQFVGTELLRYLRLFSQDGKLRYWRDHNGPEVDYVLDIHKRYIPIEVKWTPHPNASDAEHLNLFLQEYDCYDIGYIICRCNHPLKINDRVTALPWQELPYLTRFLE